MTTGKTVFWATAAAGLLLVACDRAPLLAVSDDPADISERLDQPGGGFDDLNEPPGFGDPEDPYLSCEPVDPAPDNLEPPALPPVGPVPGCTADRGGLLQAGWFEAEGGIGFFKGKWTDRAGKVTGNIVGIFDAADDGTPGRFFGKHIDCDGAHLGFVQGEVRGPHFVGTWRGTDGQEGRLWGSRHAFYALAPQRRQGPGREYSGSGGREAGDRGIGKTVMRCSRPPLPSPGWGQFDGVWEQPALCPPQVSACEASGGYCSATRGCKSGFVSEGGGTCQTFVDGPGDAVLATSLAASASAASSDAASQTCCVPRPAPFSPSPNIGQSRRTAQQGAPQSNTDK